MVARYIVLDADLGHDRQLIRIATGRHAGMELVMSTRDIRGVSRLDVLLGQEVVRVGGEEFPEAAAERLLVSLLDDRQRSDWDRDRTFWVDTDFGRLQLGRLYDIFCRPFEGESLHLCVVPTDHHSLPKCDIWANLLLVLRGDPDRFLEVANWKRGIGSWHRGPVPIARVDSIQHRAERGYH